MNKRSGKLKKIEIALLVGVAVSLLWGVWAMSEQQQLADRVIRLHVIANSDRTEDQELKLQVRDRILDTVNGLVAQGDDLETVRTKLGGSLDDIAREAEEEVRAEGYDYRVSASMEQTYFPTKQYEDFALPAGNYTALRVVIGEGAGKNWWCVVFPPLCLAAAEGGVTETALNAGLTDKDVSLITEENTQYVLKFKSIELWEKLKRHFSQQK